MILTMNSGVLADAAKSSLKVVDQKSATPLMHGVRITADSGIELLTTNGTEWVSLERHAVVEEPGETVVSCKTLADIAKTLPDKPVSMETDGPMLVLKCGRSTYRLNTLDANDFKTVPDMDEGRSVSLSVETLLDMADIACQAAGKDASRPIMTGVHLVVSDGRARMEATDTYRLVSVDAAGDGDFEAVIPAQRLRDALGMMSGDVTIYSDGRRICLHSGNVTYVTRAIEGAFPNFKQLLPNGSSTELRFVPEDMSEALSRVMTMAKENPTVRIDIDPEQMFVQLSCQSMTNGEAKDVITGDVEGEPIGIAFNVRYIKAAVDAMGEEAVMELNGGMQPAILKSYGGMNVIYLVMPVRL